MKKNKSQPEASPLSGSRLQTLALFIILLSFFLVLNSISTFEEEKVRPVIESIEATFANRVIRKELAPSTTENEDIKATKEGQVYDHIKSLFQSQFTKISDTYIDDKKGLFVTKIPLRELEKAVIDIRPHSLKEIRRSGKFTTLLKNLMSYKDAKLRIDFVILVPNNFLNTPQENQINISNKISYIGKKLTLAGLPESRLSIGIEESSIASPQEPVAKETMAMVIIRPHTTYSPFSELEGGEDE